MSIWLFCAESVSTCFVMLNHVGSASDFTKNQLHFLQCLLVSEHVLSELTMCPLTPQIEVYAPLYYPAPKRKRPSSCLRLWNVAQIECFRFGFICWRRYSGRKFALSVSRGSDGKRYYLGPWIWAIWSDHKMSAFSGRGD